MRILELKLFPRTIILKAEFGDRERLLREAFLTASFNILVRLELFRAIQSLNGGFFLISSSFSTYLKFFYEINSKYFGLLWL